MQRTYRHIVLEGTPYECGRQLGAHIRGRSGPEYAMYAGARPGQQDLCAAELDKFLACNDKYLPGVCQEIRGFADGLGIPMERLAANMMWYRQAGHCSHLAALPGATENGHVLAARSYEWSLDDALCLVTTRAKDRYAHIGFSVFALGRFDGMNEKGLCVTMSCGAPGKNSPGKPPEADGFAFWAGIRAALDRCATVDEALALVTSLPSCTYDNIILSDRSGEAALVENACGFRAVKRIGEGSPERCLYSANHYTIPGMREKGEAPMWMSAVRSQRMERFFREIPAVTADSLKALLGAPVPEGLCCHYYGEWFGTLWSMVFDLTDGCADVCFGSPAVNGWHRFGLDGPVGVQEYPAEMPDEKCTDSGFFAKV